MPRHGTDDSSGVRAYTIDTGDNGIPHHRERLYIFGLHQDVATQALIWPARLVPMQLKDLLQPASPQDDAARRPAAEVARLAVDIATRKAAAMQPALNEDWIVNVHHSRKWTLKGSRPAEVCPRGPWLGLRGRHTLVGVHIDPQHPWLCRWSRISERPSDLLVCLQL